MAQQTFPGRCPRLHGACAPFQSRYELGSDYHGANRPNIFLGTGRGILRIGTDVLNELLRRFA
ncbi:MAG: hypothetical protein LBV65_02525 [Desulfovibrio sp.]|nr:hypothetical protein [Desulfovibrio sp.]